MQKRLGRSRTRDSGAQIEPALLRGKISRTKSVQVGKPAPRIARLTKGAGRRVSSGERRELILTAARQVFVRAGFGGARTKDIAIEAGINEALIYRHFASKEELFDAAVIEPLDRWIKTYHHLGPQIAASESETQLELMQRTAAEWIDQIHAVLPLLCIALFASEGHGADFYVKRFSPMIERWSQRSKAAMPAGARGAHLPPRFLATAGIGVAVFTTLDAQFRNVPFDAKLLGRQMATLMQPMFEHHAKPAPKSRAKRA